MIKKFENKKAWDYILQNKDYIQNVINSFIKFNQEDIMQYVLIDLYIKLSKKTLFTKDDYIVNFNTIVKNTTKDILKKHYKYCKHEITVGNDPTC